MCLDHHIFIPGYNVWRRSSSKPQPLVRVQLNIEPKDYHHFDLDAPEVPESFLDGVADTGAQSCLMGSKMFYRCGFSK